MNKNEQCYMMDFGSCVLYFPFVFPDSSRCISCFHSLQFRLYRTQIDSPTVSTPPPPPSAPPPRISGGASRLRVFGAHEDHGLLPAHGNPRQSGAGASGGGNSTVSEALLEIVRIAKVQRLRAGRSPGLALRLELCAPALLCLSFCLCICLHCSSLTL